MVVGVRRGKGGGWCGGGRGGGKVWVGVGWEGSDATAFHLVIIKPCSYRHISPLTTRFAHEHNSSCQCKLPYHDHCKTYHRIAALTTNDTATTTIYLSTPCLCCNYILTIAKLCQPSRLHYTLQQYCNATTYHTTTNKIICYYKYHATTVTVT